MSQHKAIKAEIIEDLNHSDLEDEIDDLDELLRGAQSIIEEYQATSHRSRFVDISDIPENLCREVEEILSGTMDITEQNELSNILTTEAEAAQIEEDDDVVFISSEPSRMPADLHVIDLCTPDQRAIIRRTRRRPTANDTLLVSPSSVDTNPISSDINISIQEPAASTSTDLLKLTCAVCMDNPTRHSPMATVCGHIFCKKCIVQAIKCTKKCPLCNKKLTKALVHRIYI